MVEWITEATDQRTFLFLVLGGSRRILFKAPCWVGIELVTVHTFFIFKELLNHLDLLLAIMTYDTCEHMLVISVEGCQLPEDLATFLGRRYILLRLYNLSNSTLAPSLQLGLLNHLCLGSSTSSVCRRLPTSLLLLWRLCYSRCSLFLIGLLICERCLRYRCVLLGVLCLCLMTRELN